MLTEQFGLAYDIKDYQEHAMEAGSDSSAAAYILSERGFNAHVLKGGLNQLAGNRPKNEAEEVSAD